MSHVAVQETKPGEPMFADLEALRMAADMLGGEIVKKKDYKWWGRSAGDYPLPLGMTADQLGKNAEYVLRVRPEKYAELGVSGEPYELGLIADPNNPGCFIPMWDWFCGGMGLNKVIGDPLFADQAKKQVTSLCPKLKQFYDMCCDKLAAAQAGDVINFFTLADARVKYPQLFGQSAPLPTDGDTWVSIAETEGRVAQNA